MHNRRSSKLKFDPEEEEKLALAALDDEDRGKLSDAVKRWKELSAKKGNADANLHAWGLVGERYARELQAVEERYAQLRKAIEEERTLGTKASAANDLEKTALDAVRAEIAGERAKVSEEEKSQFTRAINKWDDVKTATEAPERRPWHLLALKRLHDLRDKR